jgi:hypothetical protein
MSDKADGHDVGGLYTADESRKMLEESRDATPMIHEPIIGEIYDAVQDCHDQYQNGSITLYELIEKLHKLHASCLVSFADYRSSYEASNT